MTTINKQPKNSGFQSLTEQEKEKKVKGKINGGSGLPFSGQQNWSKSTSEVTPQQQNSNTRGE